MGTPQGFSNFSIAQKMEKNTHLLWTPPVLGPVEADKMQFYEKLRSKNRDFLNSNEDVLRLTRVYPQLIFDKLILSRKLILYLSRYI